MKASSKKTNITLFLFIGLIIFFAIGYFVFTFLRGSSPSATDSNIENTNSGKSIDDLRNVVEYRVAVIDGINIKRTELGLKNLKVDGNLCVVAKTLAGDRAANYPDKRDKAIVFSDPQLKSYIQEYKNIFQTEFTMNDIYVKAMKDASQKVTLTDDHITRVFTDSSDTLNVALDSELTHGCVAISPEKVGYKPFVYFVGGVKK